MYKKILDFKVIFNAQYVGCGNCCLPCKYVFDMWQFIKKKRKHNYRNKYNYLKMKKVFKTTNYYKKNKISFR